MIDLSAGTVNCLQETTSSLSKKKEKLISVVFIFIFPVTYQIECNIWIISFSRFFSPPPVSIEKLWRHPRNSIPCRAGQFVARNIEDLQIWSICCQKYRRFEELVNLLPEILRIWRAGQFVARTIEALKICCLVWGFVSWNIEGLRRTYGNLNI